MLLTVLASLVLTVPTTGEEVIRMMHDRYDGLWYETLTFVQETTYYNPDGGVNRVEMWNESIRLPGMLRIDIAPLADGRGMLFRNDTLFAIQGGAAANPRALVHPLLLMGFDVYHIPVEESVAKLRSLGVDLTRVHENTWEGRPVWVIGADEGDLTSNQFWIDQERLVFVRQVNGASDTRFNKYEPLGDAWIAPEVVFMNGDQVTLLEEYTDIRIDVSLDDGVFDAARLARPAWYPGG